MTIESITDAFHALSHICVEECLELSSVQYTLSPRWFYSLDVHSVERWRCFSIVLQHTSNHHHPYIDPYIDI